MNKKPVKEQIIANEETHTISITLKTMDIARIFASMKYQTYLHLHTYTETQINNRYTYNLYLHIHCTHGYLKLI